MLDEDNCINLNLFSMPESRLNNLNKPHDISECCRIYCVNENININFANEICIYNWNSKLHFFYWKQSTKQYDLI